MPILMFTNSLVSNVSIFCFSKFDLKTDSMKINKKYLMIHFQKYSAYPSYLYFNQCFLLSSTNSLIDTSIREPAFSQSTWYLEAEEMDVSPGSNIHQIFGLC